MSRLTRYGVAMAPAGAIATLLRGELNAWSYNDADPINSLRDRSVQLRNICDDALAAYTAQLQQELHRLRSSLPQPTRENPYPPADGVEAVHDLEHYLRDIESLRVRLQGAAAPPREMVRHGQGDNRLLFAELEGLDKDLMSTLAEVTDDSLHRVQLLLDQRTEKLRQFATA